MHRLYKAAARIAVLGLMLGTCQGRVALYSTEDPQPLQVYPYRVEAFPDRDQKALEAGIPVRDEGHLQQLLQDFLS